MEEGVGGVSSYYHQAAIKGLDKQAILEFLHIHIYKQNKIWLHNI